MKKNNYNNFNTKELRSEFRLLTKNNEATEDDFKNLERKILYKIKSAPNQAFSAEVLYADFMAFKGNYGRSNMYYLMALENNHKAHWLLYCIGKNLVFQNREKEALGYLRTLSCCYGKNDGRCDLNTLINLLENLIYNQKIDIEYSNNMFSREINGDLILYEYNKLITLLNKKEFTEVLLVIDALKSIQRFLNIKGDLEFLEKIVDSIIKRQNYEYVMGLDNKYSLLDETMQNEEYDKALILIKELVNKDENAKMSVFRHMYTLILKGYVDECKSIILSLNTKNNMNIISHLKNIIIDIENDITDEEYNKCENKAYEEGNLELAYDYALEGYNNTKNPLYAYTAGSIALDLHMDEEAVKYLELSVKHNGKKYLKTLQKLYKIMDRNGEYEKAIKYFDQYSRAHVMYTIKKPLKPFFSSSFNNINTVIDEDLYNEIADYIQFGYFDIAEEMIKRLQNKKDKTNSEKQTLKLINSNKKLLLMKSKKADE